MGASIYGCWTRGAGVAFITKFAASFWAFCVSDGLTKSVRKPCVAAVVDEHAAGSPKAAGLKAGPTNSSNVPVPPGVKNAALAGSGPVGIVLAQTRPNGLGTVSSQLATWV